MKAVWMKVLSLFLVLVLVANMLPMGVFAQQVQENADAAGTDVTEEVASDDAMQPEEIGEAEIVNELTEKRNAYTKSFRLDNGLNMAVTYADAVHYETETGWEEIDNTLKKTVDGYYTNTAGDWDVRFPRQLSSGNVEIERDGYTLSFSFSGALHNDNLQRSVGAYRVDKAKTSYGKEQQLEQAEPLEHPQAVPQKNHSQLTYADVYQNTDVIYDLLGNQVKESIVLESYDSSLQGYTYALNTGDMLPVLEEDGQITLYDPAQENVILVMPAPYVLDDANAYSNDVQVQLTGSNGSYTLTYLLPKQWLAAEERAWPVVLDPIVTPEMVRSNVRDVSVAQKTTSGTSTGGNNAGTLSCGVGSVYGLTRTFVKYADLPEMDDTETVVHADITMYTAQDYSATVPVEVHKVNSAWESESTTWSNQPACNSVVEDYNIVGGTSIGTGYTWNVTDIVRDWYSDSNTGMMFQVPSSITSNGTNSLRQFFSSDYGTQNSRPTLYVYYRDMSGLEDRYSYQSLSAGHAGSAYICDATGQLIAVKNIASYASSVNPFNLNLVYNPAKSAQTTHGIDMLFGSGFTLDMIQSIKDANIENAVGKYLVWHDGDGTSHYFIKQSDGSYLDEDGLNLTVIKSGSDYTMTDDQGNRWLFDDGLLYQYNDESGNKIVIEWKGSGSTRYFHRIYQQNNGSSTQTDMVTVNYIAGTSYINTLTDAAGRVYTFVYSNGNLTGIKQGTTQIARYDYNGSRLAGMLDMESNYWLWFTYENGRVKQYQEWVYNGSNVAATPGAAVSITYADETTTYRDHGTDREKNNADDILTSYVFDYWGRTINAYSTDSSLKVLGASNTVYSGAGETTNLRKNNRTMQTASTGVAAENLLKNHSFESGISGWIVSGLGSNATLQASEEASRTGYCSLEGHVTESGKSLSAYRGQMLTAETTYTLSAYVNTTWVDSFGGGGIRVVAHNSDYGTWHSSLLNYKTNGTADGWTRISVTFTPTVSATYNLMMQSLNVTGWFYVDDFQLEKGEAPSNYNLIENGNLELGQTGWLMQSGTSYATEYPYDANNDLIAMSGSLTNEACAWQNVQVNAPGTQTYVLSGWAWAYSVPDDDSAHTNENYAGNTTKSFGLRATVRYTDGTQEHHYVPFCPDVNTWQFASLTVVPKAPTKTVNYIQVVLAYEKNANSAWFDRISLVKEAAQTMRYNSYGKLEAVTTTGMKDQSAEYENGNLIKSYTGSSGTYTYAYDDTYKHRVTAVDDGVVKQTYSYGSYGNVTGTSLTKKDGTGTALTTSAVYQGYGNRVFSVTDANGNTVWNYYDTALSKMTGVPTKVSTALPGTQIEDASTAWLDTETAYDTFGRTTSVAINQKNYGTTVATPATIGYTYSKGNLTKIQRNASGATQNYTLGYDAWGNNTSVSVGDWRLATYTYGSGNGLMQSMTYGNNDKVSYTYDNLGRTKTATYKDKNNNTTRILSYTYTGDGQLSSIHDSSTNKYYFCTYDTLGRLVNSANGNMRTGYKYDDYARLVRRSYKDTVFGDGYETYTYDTNTSNAISDGTLTSIRMVSGDTLVYDYDALQRLSNKYSSGKVWEQYTYNGTRVASKKNWIGDTLIHTYTYAYDAVGNITGETLNGSTTSYTYDKLNQLTQVKKDGVVKETYAYDNAGNITSFNNGSGKNYTLTYADIWGWKDLLTSVTKNGETHNFTYDNLGNPLTYYNGYSLNYYFTWTEGRRLATYTYNEETTAYEYDHTGLRTKKTNPDGTYFVYHIADGRYVGETRYNSNNAPYLYMQYIYDESDSIYGISLWQPGQSTAWEHYYFVKNLQGDVQQIYRASDNALVATYSYDAWGNVLSSNSFQTFYGRAVSQLNPFRYRGYYFDNETYFYYLQSRYYDPAIGRFINADGFVSTGQGVLGYNMFAYCGNNPVLYIDCKGTRHEISAGSCGGFSTSSAKGYNKDNILRKTKQLIGAVVSNVDVEVGIGLGMCGNTNKLDMIDLEIGLRYDLLSIGYKDGHLYCQQEYFTGVEGTVFVVWDIDIHSESKVRNTPFSKDFGSWEEYRTNDIWTIYGGGLYLVGGARYHIGLDVISLIEDIDSIFK